jgi:hypothetical protein
MAREDKFEKPDWFNIDNYLTTKDLTPLEWAYQLYYRYNLFYNLLDRCVICEQPFCGEDDRLEFDEKIKNLKENPIQKTPEDFSSEPTFYFCEEHSLPGLKFISPTSREVAKYAPWEIPIEGCEHKFPHTSSCFDYIESDGIFDAQSTNISSKDGVVFLNADLNASDDMLIDEFKLYLKHVRKFYNYQEGGLKGSSIVKRLVESKVLPYLDIFIHSQTIGDDNSKKFQPIAYPYYLIGDWIFPNEQVDRVEKIRRGTKPLAERALRHHFISVLANLPV